jgi:hypothetical protein
MDSSRHVVAVPSPEFPPRAASPIASGKTPSRTEPNIIPLPQVSWAWATVRFSPETAKCFSNPKAWQSHSIAAGAFRYRIAGIIVAVLSVIDESISERQARVIFSRTKASSTATERSLRTWTQSSYRSVHARRLKMTVLEEKLTAYAWGTGSFVTPR